MLAIPGNGNGKETPTGLEVLVALLVHIYKPFHFKSWNESIT